MKNFQWSLVFGLSSERIERVWLSHKIKTRAHTDCKCSCGMQAGSASIRTPKFEKNIPVRQQLLLQRGELAGAERDPLGAESERGKPAPPRCAVHVDASIPFYLLPVGLYLSVRDLSMSADSRAKQETQGDAA